MKLTLEPSVQIALPMWWAWPMQVKAHTDQQAAPLVRKGGLLLPGCLHPGHESLSHL